MPAPTYVNVPKYVYFGIGECIVSHRHKCRYV